MKIDKCIAERIDSIIYEGGNLTSDRTLRVARKGPVEIESIDRRGPPTSDHRMDIVGRHQNEPALHLTGIEVPYQVAYRYRTLILIPVVSPFKDHGGPGAV